MTKQWRILLVLIFILIVVLFSIANVETVGFSYLFGVVRLPLILIIISSLIIGALLIGSFTYPSIYRQRRRIGKLEREVDRMIELHPEDSDRLNIAASGEEPQNSETRSARRSKK
ncbi:LapA family protein [Sporolactobacillus sp. CPB3-1]|uniref:LapA family protein n=1 Tax=Sporolactobacillus mangiferae TaxID=2940498 RepID=A0ABT0M757_9BACL|nr:LapA family protein [Sporolactobacillus mangiferae]MCL1630488.1 LapA family protein [Sporolactobacillus mangiferae]